MEKYLKTLNNKWLRTQTLTNAAVIEIKDNSVAYIQLQNLNNNILKYFNQIYIMYI